MTLGQVSLLGALQGITEFLPISSDGHLALLQAAWGFRGDLLGLDVALHAGTLGSMLLFFRKDFLKMFRGLVSREETASRRLERRRIFYIFLATVPTGIVGLALKKTVEGLGASFLAAGAGFFVTAAFLAAGEWGFRRADRGIERISGWKILVLGFVQGAAVWPGWSRSGSTIATALVLGWRWEEAGPFSFLMAVPAIAGATLLETRAILALDPAHVLTGMLASFVVGCFALWLLMKFLAARRLWPFAVYCALAGTYSLLRGFSGNPF